ncbi:hypothetical protein [Hephaestia caeni]|uniref:hypothetical protein n=1 Tax=Hephaestia caeni TaxID=645617 RepID=UPI0011C3733C|nr:hypothetical protein [Hephaestia caeni]
MSDNDQSYYLSRALFHRRRLETATCSEARLCHDKLVRAYQRRLAEIRRQRGTRLEQAPMVLPARATLSLFGSGGAKTRISETC